MPRALSTRSAESRAKPGRIGVQRLEVAPRPWIIRTGSPPPVGASYSTAICSMNSVAMRGSRDRGWTQAARRADVGLLVEDAVLHHREDSRRVLQHRDIGGGIAVDEEKIGEGTLP